MHIWILLKYRFWFRGFGVRLKISHFYVSSWGWCCWPRTTFLVAKCWSTFIYVCLHVYSFIGLKRARYSHTYIQLIAFLLQLQQWSSSFELCFVTKIFFSNLYLSGVIIYTVFKNQIINEWWKLAVWLFGACH